MPHFVIEYFAADPQNFDPMRACEIGFAVGAASGIMNPADIKLRTLRAEHILMGDGRQSFLHVTVSLLAGRTDAAKLDLADALVAALRAAFPRIEAISVDTRDMNPACYRKDLL